MALSADALLPYRQGASPNEFGYVVQAGSRVYRGSMVALCNDGTIAPAGTGTNPAGVVGIAQRYQDYTGVAGAFPSGLSGSTSRVHVRRGTFLLPFDTAPTPANINAAVYAVDDATVTLTATGHLRVGTLVGFDENGAPWVQV